jgi:hypothetical protein
MYNLNWNGIIIKICLSVLFIAVFMLFGVVFIGTMLNLLYNSLNNPITQLPGVKEYDLAEEAIDWILTTWFLTSIPCLWVYKIKPDKFSNLYSSP